MSTAVPEPFAEEQNAKEISQNYWVLVWWRFRQNKLAMFGGFLIIAYYFVCALTAEFWSPYLVDTVSDYLEAGRPSGCSSAMRAGFRPGPSSTA